MNVRLTEAEIHAVSMACRTAVGSIPKPDGGVRKLGVPCVVDRLIQQAVLQVLQEQWDPTFSGHSYGFDRGARPIRRWPKRSAMLPRATALWSTLISKNFWNVLHNAPWFMR